MYKPSEEILEKYANLLINFALGSGKGIKKGEVVFAILPECAKPFYLPLQKAILKSGGHPMIQYLPDNVDRAFYELANEEQLNFFASEYLKARVDLIDHYLRIEAETNKKELEGIDPKKIMDRSKVSKPYREWMDEKEKAGKFTWTIALYGTEEMAKEAGLTLEEYWGQIIKACYLDSKDTIGEWNRIFNEVDRLKNKLNNLNIRKIHIKSEGTDLIVGLGEKRQWLGGSGRNIPSFEVFVSPDWRETQGHITINQPLYRYGTLIKDIYLEFKDGLIVKFSAKEGEDVLKEMIASDGGSNKIGEFSLTDIRLSKIDKFMAETLFDENFGGKYGNTHVAIGKAYKDSFNGDAEKLSKEEWEKLGFNESVVHTDVISSVNREVYATLGNGKEILIYKDGQFVI